MKKKILYTCEICHTDYADDKKAKECEKSHKGTVITGFRYGAMEAFPRAIHIKLETGETAIYKR